MPIHHVIVLALVQAITEFLPISSTAHLALVPWLLKWRDPGLTYDVALHLGTLAAVLLYFWRVWLRLLLSAFGRITPLESESPARSPDDDEAAGDRRLLWLLIAGTVPAAVIGFAFEDFVETTLRSPFVMGTSLILVALLMWQVDRTSRQVRGLADLRLGDAVSVGFAQAVALIPGVSRSGITISAALMRDFRRDTAARFSFLLSTPVVAGAVLKKGFDLWRVGVEPNMVAPFVIGIVVAGLAGYAVIAFLIRYLQTRTLKIFIYYRIIFGIIILFLAIFSSAP